MCSELFLLVSVQLELSNRKLQAELEELNKKVKTYLLPVVYI